MDNTSKKNMSYKAIMALSAATTLNVKTENIDLTSNRLILVTSAGIITGDYVFDNDQDYQDDPEFFIMDQISSQAEEFSSEPKNSILLSNVEILSANGTKFSFHYLHVFTDDIIGISFGNTN